MKRKTNEHGILFDECYGCHKDEMLCKMGKMKGNIYCNLCYLTLLDLNIKDWAILFRRFRNGRSQLTRNEIYGENFPKLSSFIN